MSTVTLSKPHCAITSAVKPEGVASHALTTALPDFQVSLTLFAMLPSFPVDQCRCHCARRKSKSENLAAVMLWVVPELTLLARTQFSQLVALWILDSLTPTSRAVFTIAAQVSSGKGTPFLVRSARVFRSGSPGTSTCSTPATGLVARMKSV